MLVARRALDGGERGGADQHAAFVARFGARLHVPGGGAEGEEGTAQVDVQHPVPLLDGSSTKRGAATAGDAGIGEAAIDPAQEVERLGEGGLDLGLLGDVALQGEDPAAGGFELRLRGGILLGMVPQMAMSDPASAMACAMPRPMPPLPPVTSATFPVRSNGL